MPYIAYSVGVMNEVEGITCNDSIEAYSKMVVVRKKYGREVAVFHANTSTWFGYTDKTYKPFWFPISHEKIDKRIRLYHLITQ